MHKKKCKRLLPLLVVGALLLPTSIEARGMGHASHASHVSHVSHSSHVARPSVSRPSISRPSVSKPSTSSRPSSSVKSSSSKPSSSKPASKPSSLKSGTTTLKTKKGESIPKTNSKSKPTSTDKKTTETKKPDSSAVKNTKVDSINKFSTKPKTETKKEDKKEQKTESKPKTSSSYKYTVKPRPVTSTSHFAPGYTPYYNSYSSQPSHYSSGLDFWDYYMLSNLFKDKKDEITDRDIAKELESRGYTKDEVDKILKEGKEQQKQADKKKAEEKKIIDQKKAKEDKKEKIFKYSLIGGSLVCIGGIIYIFRKNHL